jgi:hypothetical protein
MAVSRWRGEGRTQEGRWWEGMNAELASADAREGRQPKSMFAGGGATGGRGAPRTAEEAAGGRQLRDGGMGVGIRVWSIYICGIHGPARLVGWAGWCLDGPLSCFNGPLSCLNGSPFRVVFVLALRVEIVDHRVVPALTLRPSCRARVRVVFFSVVCRAARRVWPIWISIILVNQEWE